MRRITRLSAALVVAAAAFGLTAGAPSGAMAKRMEFRVTVLNQSSQTLQYDADESFAYSRLWGVEFLNFAHYAWHFRPQAEIAPGASATMKLYGYNAEGLMSSIVYKGALNGDQKVGFDSHIHMPPHVNWMAPWSTAGFDATLNYDEYSDYKMVGTGIVTDGTGVMTVKKAPTGMDIAQLSGHAKQQRAAIAAAKQAKAKKNAPKPVAKPAAPKPAAVAVR